MTTNAGFETLRYNPNRLTDEELKENEVFSMSSQLRWFDGELQQAWFGIQTGRVRWEPVPSFVRPQQY